VRLITWNVNRRVSLLPAQAAALATRDPDVVALQEITARSWPLWRAALAGAGLEHAICSLDGADPDRSPAARRRTGVALAAREPLEPAEPLAVPWPETTIAAHPRGAPRRPRRDRRPPRRLRRLQHAAPGVTRRIGDLVRA
jgi:exonuclease III